MKTKVTLSERLRDLRAERKLTQDDVASATGISSSSISTYESDDTLGIPHFNLVKLADFYGVSLDYLFDKSPIRENVNIEIAELGLDSETLALLKSNKLNNRLLAELMKHPEFKNLLADIEIYVDGNAGILFQALSASINTYREEILHDMPKEKDDIVNRVLEVSKFEEDLYFQNRIQSTLKPILDDLRELHKKDAETSTDVSFSKMFKEKLKDINCYDEDLANTFILTTCKIHDIPRSALTKEQEDVLKSIMLKSKKYKNAVQSRKNSKKKNHK
ncbi:helix-turn-helix domain-containing protein [Pseudobutyrivibrio ruminis]|uniref:helix-turn-helix domain-containing protein n=1 Tax=Pseudobutyrivibrio ruminis TaxID=46206 RepID=UPI00068DB365|nr:helix-turn-helix domain-containing protein [Pseudobutyrivibrio ruminis]